LPVTNTIFAGLYERSRSTTEIVYGQPRARLVGVVMGHVLAISVAVVVVNAMRVRYSGWSLLLPCAGLTFVAVWLVGWTRQEFAQYTLRLNASARVAHFQFKSFLGKSKTSSIEAEQVESVLLLSGNPWRLALVLRTGEQFTVDASSNSDPLRALGESLAKTFQVPFRDSDLSRS
jgi:hypothetical protein